MDCPAPSHPLPIKTLSSSSVHIEHSPISTMRICSIILALLFAAPLVPPDVVSLIPRGRADCHPFKPSGAGTRAFIGYIDDDPSSNSSVADLDPLIVPAKAPRATAVAPSTPAPAFVAPARDRQSTTPLAALPSHASPNVECCPVSFADIPLERPRFLPALSLPSSPKVLPLPRPTIPAPAVCAANTNTSLISASQDPPSPFILFSVMPVLGDDNTESKTTFAAGGFALVGAAFTALFALALLSTSNVRLLNIVSMVMVSHRPFCSIVRLPPLCPKWTSWKTRMLSKLIPARLDSITYFVTHHTYLLRYRRSPPHPLLVSKSRLAKLTG